MDTFARNSLNTYRKRVWLGSFSYFCNENNYTLFSISKTFISNTETYWSWKVCYLKIIHILHSHYHPKVIGQILKNKQKNKCVCIHEIIRLIIMKMKMKMKNRSHRYVINRPRSRHGRKYSKYIMSLTMMMVKFIKQHLSNIWSSIQDKVKQLWGWV